MSGKGWMDIWPVKRVVRPPNHLLACFFILVGANPMPGYVYKNASVTGRVVCKRIEPQALI